MFAQNPEWANLSRPNGEALIQRVESTVQEADKQLAIVVNASGRLKTIGED
ncbi:hypothetical protein sscle_08g067300 [Sclerotinia sclerotiorum 1980 UF-70]|uniref:Uncharacterized protein n=1 Tax=Sclerotinia sclerotiorum (strain ATCC 18683 / 1980 / Ss-1) TaxID=665079 RepID=A0A1D9QAH6_SCLS1|nr:hypothetical protein sscle_08g067300 [Sclerotinia sclerotiorum 1980 UF-70]